MEKICKSCGISKLLDDYHRSSKNKDGRQRLCKDCNRIQRNNYYKTAAGRHSGIMSGRRLREQNNVKLFNYFLEHPCVDCGESNPVVLQFDHIDPALKSYDISSHMRKKTWTTLLLEINKCEVRCANCHTLRTAHQFNWQSLVLWNNHNK